MDAPWLWIPITLCAAMAQTFRNAAQRRLTAELGTLGATWVRFLYGLPFALLASLAVLQLGSAPGSQGGASVGAVETAASQGAAGLQLALQAVRSAPFMGWVVLGAVAQILATAALLRAMAERGFALGVAYAKSEVLMVAAFGLVALGDRLTAGTVLAALIGTLGVLLLAPADPQRPLRALVDGWASRAARYGLASGAGFAIAAVAFRGATLQLLEQTAAAPAPLSPLQAAACTLSVSLALQTAMLGAHLLWRHPQVVRAVLRLWRPSMAAGALGALASGCWFTAFALQSAAAVRTLGLVELVFSYAVSLRLFREGFTGREQLGMLLLGLGLVLVSLQG